MKTILNISYGKEPEQNLEVYLPDIDAFPVFVYLHGGSLQSGSAGEVSMVYEYMASQGIAVVAGNYRKYPGAKYPDFVEDAAAIVAWTIDNMSAHGNVQGVYVGGSSAGGYLSMMLCFDQRWLGKYGIDASQISGYVHDAGQPTCHFKVLRERGVDMRRVIVDDSAPLYHIGEAEEYPPMLIVVSDNDMTNRYEQTMLVMSTLKHFEYDMSKVQLKVMHGGHCDYVKRLDKDGKSELGSIVCDYIKEIMRLS